MIDEGTRATPHSIAGSEPATDYLLGRTERRGHRGVQTFADGYHRFSVALLGSGSLDWDFDPELGELRLLALRGTDSTTSISIVRLAGHDFHVADARLDGAIGSFRSNALFGELTFRGQLGPFAFSDGRLEVQLVFPTETVVHYDGAVGTLDATPADGSLMIETPKDLWATETELALCARPSLPTAEVPWSQVRGPRLPFEADIDGRCSIKAGQLPPGRRALFVVAARDHDALAVETVVLRSGIQG